MTAATENVTYKATFERKYYEYTVCFLDFDDSVIAQKTYRYGAAVEIPETPVREGYIFVGWDQEIGKVETNAVYKAVYEIVFDGEHTDSDSSSEETSEDTESSVSSEEIESSSSAESSELEDSDTESSSSVNDGSAEISSSSTAGGNAKKGGCGGTIGALRGSVLGVCAIAVIFVLFLRKKENRG